MIQLRFSTGELVRLDGRKLVGRAPVIHPGEEASRVVLNSPDRAVSKTHLELGYDDGIAWVLDRHSRNGTAIVRSGNTRVLEPERRVPLEPGDTVRLGRTTSFTVEDSA